MLCTWRPQMRIAKVSTFAGCRSSKGTTVMRSLRWLAARSMWSSSAFYEDLWQRSIVTHKIEASRQIGSGEGSCARYSKQHLKWSWWSICPQNWDLQRRCTHWTCKSSNIISPVGLLWHMSEQQHIHVGQSAAKHAEPTLNKWVQSQAQQLTALSCPGQIIMVWHASC